MSDKWKGLARFFDGTVTEVSAGSPAECLSELADHTAPRVPFDEVLVMSFVHIKDTDPPTRGAELAPVALAAARVESGAAVLRDLERLELERDA